MYIEERETSPFFYNYGGVKMYKVLYGEEIKKYTNTFKRMEKLLPKLNEAECIILEEDKETIG